MYSGVGMPVLHAVSPLEVFANRKTIPVEGGALLSPRAWMQREPFLAAQMIDPFLYALYLTLTPTGKTSGLAVTNLYVAAVRQDRRDALLNQAETKGWLTASGKTALKKFILSMPSRRVLESSGERAAHGMGEFFAYNGMGYDDSIPPPNCPNVINWVMGALVGGATVWFLLPRRA